MVKGKWAGMAAVRRKAGYASVEKGGDGFTVREYAEKFAITVSTATHELEMMCRRGELQSTVERRIDAGGRRRTVKVYRPN